MPDEEKMPFNLLGERGFLFWSAVILLVIGFPFIGFVLGKASGVGIFKPAIHKCELLQGQGESDEERDAAQKKDPSQKENADRKKDTCSGPFIGLTWLAIISCAALFGALGVMLSLVLRRKVDERLLKLTIPKILIVVYGVGSIFAILVLALFIGKFLEGNLFPKFASDSWIDISFRLQDWAKLMIWSFIAGFSERLVPTLFDQLIERALPRKSDEAGQGQQNI
jgi:hypothetical protein